MKTLKAGRITAFMATAVIASPAFALGGLDQAKNTATDIQNGIYGVVGVLAVIYLLWLGVMAFTEKKSWADFGWGVIHVALVGAAVALGTWAWGLWST